MAADIGVLGPTPSSLPHCPLTTPDDPEGELLSSAGVVSSADKRGVSQTPPEPPVRPPSLHGTYPSMAEAPLPCQDLCGCQVPSPSPRAPRE